MDLARLLTIIVLLSLILGAEYIQCVHLNSDALKELRDEVVTAMTSPSVLKVETVCFTTYLIGLSVLRYRIRRSMGLGGRKDALKAVCLVVLCCLTVSRFIGTIGSSGSSDACVLVFGMALGQALGFLRSARTGMRTLDREILNAILLLLTLGVLFQCEWWDRFQYHGQRRWQGIWLNPNTFGVLMALGFVLAICQALQKREPRGPFRHAYAQFLAFLPVIALTFLGLVRSYSRTAWIGGALALSYVTFEKVKLQGHERSPRAWLALNNWLALGVALGCSAVLAFWKLRDTENLTVLRFLSIADANDFSWRNRLVAYEGGLQMMATKPWLGFGWGQAQMVYENFYMPTKLIGGQAIELNDYFMICLALGVPAFGCFLTYLYLTFKAESPYAVTRESEHWSKITSRAGLVVLFVCFFLQRGLFRLPLAVPFWILLELASPDDLCACKPHQDMSFGRTDK